VGETGESDGLGPLSTVGETGESDGLGPLSTVGETGESDGLGPVRVVQRYVTFFSAYLNWSMVRPMTRAMRITDCAPEEPRLRPMKPSL
jgi:hypothetical protein